MDEKGGKEGEEVEEEEEGEGGAQWPSNLGKLMSSRLSERLYLKTTELAVSEEDPRHGSLTSTWTMHTFPTHAHT